MKIFQLNNFAKFISILFTVLIILIFSFFLFISLKPLKISKQFFNESFFNLEEFNTKRIDEIYFRFNKVSKNFEIIIENLDTEFFSIPDLLIATDFKSIIKGDFKPKILKIYDARFNFTLSDRFMQNYELSPNIFFHSFNKKQISKNEQFENFLSNFKIIEINNSFIELANKEKKKIILEPVDIKIINQKNIKSISLSISELENVERPSGKLKLEISSDNNLYNIKIKQENFDVGKLGNFFFEEFKKFKKLTLSGESKLILSEDFNPIEAKSDLRVTAKFDGNFENNDERMFIENAKINLFFKNNDLLVNSDFIYDDSFIKLKIEKKNKCYLNIKSNNFSFEKLLKFWPAEIKTSARNWVKNNLVGKIDNLDLVLSSELDKIFNITSISGSVDYSETMMTYLYGMPRILDISGKLDITNEKLSFELENGFSRNMEIKSGSIEIYDLDKPTERAKIFLDIDTDVIDLKNYLAFSPIKKKKYQKLQKFTGKMNIGFNMELPLLLDISVDQIKFDVLAKMKNAIFYNFIDNKSLKNINIDIQISDEDISYSGNGFLDKTNLKFLAKEFDEKEEFVIYIDFDEQNLQDLTRDYIDQVYGSMNLKIIFKKYLNDYSLAGLADLSKLYISDEFLGISEELNDNSNLSFDIKKKNNKKDSNFIINSKNLNIIFSIIESGDVKKLNIKKFISPDQNFIGDANIKKKKINLNLTGKKLNLNKLLKSENNNKFNIDFDFDINELTLTGNPIYKPQIRGKINKDNFENFFFKNIQQNDIHEIKIETKNNRKYFKATSNNASNFLGFFKKDFPFKKGTLVIESVKENQKYTGDILIQEFIAYDTPFFAKLFTFFSLKGLNQKINDGGIFFDELFSEYSFNENKIFLKDGLIKGSQLGLTFNGDVNIQKELYDINGTFIPAYTINTLLTDLPIVGDIISAGSPEGGLIAANFSIKSKDEKTEFSFNPISVLVPNIIKNFLENEKNETIQP